MKKTLLIWFSVLGFCINAQNLTEKDFQQSVLQVNTSKTDNDYDNVFNKFSKFTQTKTSDRWQAYYYAAVSMYLKTELQLKKTAHQDVSESNALAGKFANGGYSQQNNTEADILSGLISLQKIQINGSKDIQKNLDAVSQLITKAETSSPNNPRLAILKAKLQERLGNKANAEKLFQQAQSGFESKNSSEGFAPTWGKQLIQSIK
jgi:ribosomal protein L17